MLLKQAHKDLRIDFKKCTVTKDGATTATPNKTAIIKTDGSVVFANTAKPTTALLTLKRAKEFTESFWAVTPKTKRTSYRLIEREKGKTTKYYFQIRAKKDGSSKKRVLRVRDIPAKTYYTCNEFATAGNNPIDPPMVTAKRLKESFMAGYRLDSVELHDVPVYKDAKKKNVVFDLKLGTDGMLYIRKPHDTAPWTPIPEDRYLETDEYAAAAEGSHSHSSNHAQNIRSYWAEVDLSGLVGIPKNTKGFTIKATHNLLDGKIKLVKP